MKRNIVAIIGSLCKDSSNIKLVNRIAELTEAFFTITLFQDLADLPHFNPDIDQDNPPASIASFRTLIAHADGVLICTPEYIFSLPSGLKNALEWCVSTTIFTEKIVGLITASASGEKAHEELGLIMHTLGARFNPETTLLIKGIKGKLNATGELLDTGIQYEIECFIQAFAKALNVQNLL
ncbi:hypothetical protein GCM10023231_19810 [Olivibacter ginsenosidimutans]|uniref:NADPH-dependent FMN reductase-like domain-containing protein n=1 Tax=Olivibacter ginsenosidimutans TaxID=1176537 RepID=A0ABP9B8B0_9SPHI